MQVATGRVESALYIGLDQAVQDKIQARVEKIGGGGLNPFIFFRHYASTAKVCSVSDTIKGVLKVAASFRNFNKASETLSQSGSAKISNASIVANSTLAILIAVRDYITKPLS